VVRRLLLTRLSGVSARAAFVGPLNLRLALPHLPCSQLFLEAAVPGLRSLSLLLELIR